MKFTTYSICLIKLRNHLLSSNSLHDFELWIINGEDKVAIGRIMNSRFFFANDILDKFELNYFKEVMLASLIMHLPEVTRSYCVNHIIIQAIIQHSQSLFQRPVQCKNALLQRIRLPSCPPNGQPSIQSPRSSYIFQLFQESTSMDPDAHWNPAPANDRPNSLFVYINLWTVSLRIQPGKNYRNCPLYDYTRFSLTLNPKPSMDAPSAKKAPNPRILRLDFADSTSLTSY
jgi:hypothetical protein